MIPDWQLPAGVDRGLWDYLHSNEMVQGYNAQMAASPLAAQDIRFCEKHFKPGSLADHGCGTGRLCHHFASRGFSCTGIDLSEEMLSEAKRTPSNVTWRNANLVELPDFPEPFDNAACLFSTLGMIRGDANRTKFLHNVHRLLKPRGVFVLHVHNRYFRALGWRRFFQSEFTMPQAYGGAPLTLRHYSRREIESLLRAAGFEILETVPVGLDNTPPRGSRIYGYLIASQRR